MAYLATGGLGFIGAYVVKALLENGRDVVVYDLGQLEGSPAMGILPNVQKNNLKIIRGSVTDAEKVSQIVKDEGINKIVHFAYMLRPGCEEDPLVAIEVNCRAMTNIFEVSRRQGVNRVVWPASLAVFGTPEHYRENLIEDDAPHYPSGFYGICKSFNERTAEYYFRRFKVDSIGLRVPRAFGWGKWTGGGQELNGILECVAMGKAVNVPNADTLTCYTYIKDIALAFVAALEVKSVTKTRTFNMPGHYHTGWELAKTLESINPKAKITPVPGIAELNIPRMRAEAITKELNWKPRYEFKEALRETVNIFREKAGLPSLSG